MQSFPVKIPLCSTSLLPKAFKEAREIITIHISRQAVGAVCGFQGLTVLVQDTSLKQLTANENQFHISICDLV